MAGSPPLTQTLPPEKNPRSSRKNTDTLLLRPSAEPGWELWATAPGAPREIGRFETVPGSTRGDLRAIAIPAHYILVLSRWLQTVDESLLPEMAQLLLERQGLAPRENGGDSLVLSVIAKEQNRLLVTFRLLALAMPEELCQPQVQRFELSADLLPLNRNGLTLWRESAHLVAAFSRNGMLVHLQSFHDAVVTPSIAIELLCTRLELETEEIILSDSAISLLGDFSEDECAILRSTLGNELRTGTPGAPQLPAKTSPLLPPLVQVLRQKKVNRQRIERILLAAAAVYAVLLLGLILNVVWITYHNQSLRKKIAADQPTVDAILSTRTRWKTIQAAVDPTIYPVEVLLQAATLLPDDGIRFTLFEENDNKVLIRGEANNAAAAFKLVEALKNRAELHYFDWQMPKPNILPNDKAEFLIEGNPPNAPAH